MDVTVVTGTFGEQEWVDLARERAWPSAKAERVPWVHAHANTLAEARNEALSRVMTEWVIHLDADDELEPGYVFELNKGTADVRAPMIRYIRKRKERMWQPRVAGHTHDCTADCLPKGNWLTIGSAVRTELVRQVGGWRQFSWSEDWDLWLRCYKADATFEMIKEAVYRAHVRPNSRNRGADQAERLAAHKAIYQANYA